MTHVKCVVVGDGTIGKTCMLCVYANNQFPKDYVPTVFDNFSANVKVDSQLVNLGLWDTAGQESYDRLRPLSYPGTDCYLICYSIDSKNSFHNIKEKWYPEVMHHNSEKRAPIILVGTKSDLRKIKPPEELISSEEGEKLSSSLKLCVKYMECSAKSNEGLKELFEECIRCVLNQKKEKPKKACVIL